MKNPKSIDIFSKYTQEPQKSEFSIMIGEFEPSKIEYLHDQIQSYYKQFVTSEQALYFFKFEDESEAFLERNTQQPSGLGFQSFQSDG